MDTTGPGEGRLDGVRTEARSEQQPRIVLVTGVSRFLGGYLTVKLAQNPSIERVIAVDAAAPSKDMFRRMGRADFVRADIRNPFIAKVIRNSDVDTVVHAGGTSHSPVSGGAALKEFNVMGAMQLFAACQKAPSLRRLILKSTSEVYGSSSHDPVLFTEDSVSYRPPSPGFPRDSVDIESYARGLARRRPDIAVTILRLANMIGPATDSALSRYLGGALVPTVFGRDARLQLLHEQDALGALEWATSAGKAGTFNISGKGVITLGQAVRRAGGVPVPLPGLGLRAVDWLRRAGKDSGISRQQLNYLSFGRVMDTTRMRVEFGYHTKWSTAEAFDDYLRGRGVRPIIDPKWVRSIEHRVVSAARSWDDLYTMLGRGGR